MSYIRHDINNNPVDPQPSSTEVTIYDGTSDVLVLVAKTITSNGDTIARSAATFYDLT